MDEKDGKPMGEVIRINEARIKDHLGEMVRDAVEVTLNTMLDAEADRLCGAARYERTEARRDTRAGGYDRKLHTKAGEVRLKVPKLRRSTFGTAVIRCRHRRESNVEEALIGMFPAGVSVRRAEDITETPRGVKVSPSTVSNLNKKIYAKIEAWRNAPIKGKHPYVYPYDIVMKRSWAGAARLWAQKHPAPHLPPYSPVLNPMGTAVQYLKDNFFANRVFESEELKTKVNGDRDDFTRQSERIGALPHGKWASKRTEHKLEKAIDQ